MGIVSFETGLYLACLDGYQDRIGQWRVLCFQHEAFTASMPIKQTVFTVALSPVNACLPQRYYTVA